MSAGDVLLDPEGSEALSQLHVVGDRVLVGHLCGHRGVLTAVQGGAVGVDLARDDLAALGQGLVDDLVVRVLGEVAVCTGQGDGRSGPVGADGRLQGELSVVGVHGCAIGLGDVEVTVGATAELLRVDPHVPGAEIRVELLPAPGDVVEGDGVDATRLRFQVVGDGGTTELDVPGQAAGLALEGVGVLAKVLLNPCDRENPLVVGVEDLDLGAVGVEGGLVVLGHLLGHDHLVARALELGGGADRGVEGAGEGLGGRDAVTHLGAVPENKIVVSTDLAVPVLRRKADAEGLVRLRIGGRGVPGELHANRVLEVRGLARKLRSVLVREDERTEGNLHPCILVRARTRCHQRDKATQCDQQYAGEQSRYILATHGEVL